MRAAWPVLMGLLRDKERVLGPQHPDNVALRGVLEQLGRAAG